MTWGWLLWMWGGCALWGLSGWLIGYKAGRRAGREQMCVVLGTVVATRLLAHGINPRHATGDCGCERFEYTPFSSMKGVN